MVAWRSGWAGLESHETLNAHVAKAEWSQCSVEKTIILDHRLNPTSSDPQRFTHELQTPKR